MTPLVSVICLCFNHERFLKEALDSVLNQTYPNLEIIVVDDFSTDNSRALLATYAAQHPQIRYLPLPQNEGNCAAFNHAFGISRGEYIVDFATDDVLLPNRIAEQVAAFEQLGPEYGLLFTDAELIDDAGNHLGNFYQRHAAGNLKEAVPTGFVLADVLEKHFISPPTVMVRRAALEAIGGYDASLTYEDFDLWVRLAAQYRFYFLDRVLTKRRVHAHQLSKQLYGAGGRHLFSTIKVCRKAIALVKTPREKQALVTRVQNELVQAVFTQNPAAARELFSLLEELNGLTLRYKLLRQTYQLPLPFAAFRKAYYRFRYNR